MDTEQPCIEVAAALVFRDSLLLITQRPEGSHLGGLWEFPGGKRESYETFAECVRRELQEELEIDVEPGAVLAEIAHAYPEKRVLLKFIRCRWRCGEPKAVGCQNFAWVTRQQLGDYSFPAADGKLLEELAGRTDWWV